MTTENQADQIRNYELRKAAQSYKPPKQEDILREKISPLMTARLWLGPRLTEHGDHYRLDRTPATLDSIMRAANALMKEAGVKQRDECERWVE